MQRGIARCLSEISVRRPLCRSFSAGQGKFAGIDMYASGAPDRGRKVEKIDLMNAPHVTTNRLGSGGWLKENPIFQEIGQDADKITEMSRQEAEHISRVSTYLEESIYSFTEGCKNDDYAAILASACLFLKQMGANPTDINKDSDARSDILQMASDLQQATDLYTKDVRDLARRHKNFYSPELLLRMIRSLNIRSVPISVTQDYTSSLYDMQALIDHILEFGTKVRVTVNSEGRLDVSVPPKIPRVSFASTLIAAFMVLMYRSLGLISGVVHTPHIGLVHVYNPKLLTTSQKPADFVGNEIFFAGKPFPIFKQKLQTCDCANKDRCTCFVTPVKHTYLDFLAGKAGFLNDAPEEGFPAPIGCNVPVPVYANAGMGLRLLCEALYVEDLQEKGKMLLHVGIRRVEDFIKYDFISEDVREHQGTRLVGTGLRWDGRDPVHIDPVTKKVRVADTDSEPEEMLERAIHMEEGPDRNM